MLSLPHTVAVLGAGGAIGRATCRAFAGAGAVVRAADLDGDAAAEAVSELEGDHLSAAVDVTGVEDLERLARRVWERGPVDSVVYAPGVVFTSDVADTNPGDYRRLMAVNLDGAFYAARTFVKHMLEAERGGSFVFISSVAGKRGEAGASAYCASKFGLIGLVQSFAAEVGSRSIRVNAVCPGNVESPMLERVARDIAVHRDWDEEDVRKEMADVAAAGRLVSPEEVAAAGLWLCSPAASAVTGEAINVDGGMLIG